MSQKKNKRNARPTQRRGSVEVSAVEAAAAQKKEAKAAREKVAKHSVFLFWFTLIALLVIFGGKWVYAIMDTYYNSFVERTSTVTDALDNMEGLSLSEEESNTLLPLEQQWDLFTSARLRDEVTVTASDGALLHGYLYNEDSDVTVVVIPRYDQDGTADFLPGTWLNEVTGCNLLLIDPRNHGESQGDYFGFGYLEQYDLVSWLDWADSALGDQTFVLWGEGVGADTILFAEASGILPDSVAFAVAESPISSIHDMADYQIWRWYTVPSFPFLNAIEWKVNHSDDGYTMQDLELGAALEQSQQQLPVLFLTSTVDSYILPEWSNEVYNSYSGEKKLISGGLNHGTVYAYLQADIQSQLGQWIESYVN